MTEEEGEWNVTLSDDAIHDLEKLIRGIGKHKLEKIVRKMMVTLRNIDKNKHKIQPIRGIDNAYRLRVGKLRVAFRIRRKEKTVEVFAIGFRETFYKKL